MSLSTPIVLHWIEKTLSGFITEVCPEYIEQINSEETSKEVSKFTKPRTSGVMVAQLFNERLKQGTWDDKKFHFSFTKGDTFVKQTLTIFHKSEVRPLSIVFVKAEIPEDAKIDSISHYSCYTYHDIVSIFTEYVVTDILAAEMNRYGPQEKLHVEWFQSFVNQFNAAIASTVNLNIPNEYEQTLSSYIYFNGSNNSRAATDDAVNNACLKIVEQWTKKVFQVVNANMKKMGELVYPEVEMDSSITLPEFEPIVHFLQKWKIYNTMLHVLSDQINDKGKKQIIRIVGRINSKDDSVYQNWKSREGDLKTRLAELKYFIVPLSELEYPLLIGLTKPAKIPYAKVGEMLNTKQIPNAYTTNLIKEVIPFYFSNIERIANDQANSKIFGYIVPLTNEYIKAMTINVDLDMENSVVALKNLLESHVFTNRTNIMDLAHDTPIISHKSPSKDMVYQESVTSSFVSEISAIELLKVVLKYALYNFDISNFITKNEVSSTRKVDLTTLRIPTHNNFVDISSVTYKNKIEKCFAYNANILLGAFFVRILSITELKNLLIDKCAILMERFPKQAVDIFGHKLSVLKQSFEQFNKIVAIENLFREIIILQLIERIESTDKGDQGSAQNINIVEDLFKDIEFSEDFHVHSFFKILQADFEKGVNMLLTKIKTLEVNVIHLIHDKFSKYLNVDYDIALRILERIMVIAGENLKNVFSDSIQEIIRINITNLELIKSKFTIFKADLDGREFVRVKPPITPHLDTLDHMLRYIRSKTKPILRLNRISEEYLSSSEGNTMTKMYYDLKKSINTTKLKLIETWMQSLVFVNIDGAPLLRVRNKKVPVKKNTNAFTNGNNNNNNNSKESEEVQDDKMYNLWDIDYEINIPKDYIQILDQLCKLKDRGVKIPETFMISKEKLSKTKRFISILEQLLTLRSILMEKFHEIKPFQMYFIPQILAIESGISPLLSTVTWSYGSIRLLFKVIFNQIIESIKLIEYFAENIHINYMKLFSIMLKDRSQLVKECLNDTIKNEQNLTGALNIESIPKFVNKVMDKISKEKEKVNKKILENTKVFNQKLHTIIGEFLRYILVIIDDNEFKIVIYKTYKNAGRISELVTNLAQAKMEILSDPMLKTIATRIVTDSLIKNVTSTVKIFIMDLLNLMVVKIIHSFMNMLLDGFVSKHHVYFEIEMVPSFPRAIYNTHPKKFLDKMCKYVIRGLERIGNVAIPSENIETNTEIITTNPNIDVPSLIKGITLNSQGARSALRYACTTSIIYKLFRRHFERVVERVSTDIYNLNMELKNYLEQSTVQIIKILIKSKEESDRRKQAILDRKRKKREQKMLKKKAAKSKSKKGKKKRRGQREKVAKEDEEEGDSVDGFLLALEEQLVNLENMAKKKIEIQKAENIIHLIPYNISLNSTNRELFIETHKAMSKLSDIMGLGIKSIIYEQKSKIQVMVKTLVSVDISMQNKLTNDEQILKYLNPKVVGRINQKLQEAADEVDLLIRLKNIALQGLRIFINKRGINPILDKEGEDNISLSSFSVNMESITVIANKSGSLTHHHIKEIDKMIDLINSTLSNRKTDFSEIMTKFKIAYSNFSSKISQDIVDINDNLNKNGLTTQISMVLKECEQASVEKGVFSYSVMMEYLRNETIRKKLIYAIKNSSRRLENFKNLSKSFIERCGFIKSIASSANIKISMIMTTVDKYKRLIFYTDKLIKKLDALIFMLSDVLNLKWNTFLTYVQQSLSNSYEDNSYKKLKSFLEKKVGKFTEQLENSGINGLNRIITFFSESELYLRNYFLKSLEMCISLNLHQTHWIYLSSLCVGNILPPPAQTIVKDFTVIDFFKIRENLNNTFNTIRYTKKLHAKVRDITSVFDRSVLIIDTLPTQFLPVWIGRHLNTNTIIVPLYLRCKGEKLLKQLTKVIQQLKSLTLKSHFEINVENEMDSKLNKLIDSLIKTKTVVINISKFQTFILYAFMLVIQSKIDFEARYSQYFGGDISSSSFVTVDPACDYRTARFPMKRPINFKETQKLLHFNPNKLNATSNISNLAELLKGNSFFQSSATDETDIGDTKLLKGEIDQLNNIQNHIEHLFALTDMEKYGLVDMFPEGRWVPRRRAQKLITMWNSLMLSIRDVNSNSAFINKIDVFDAKLQDVMNYHKVFFDDIEKQYIIFQRKICPYFAQLSSPDIIDIVICPSLPTNVPRLHWSQRLLEASPYGYISGDLSEFNQSNEDLNMGVVQETDSIEEDNKKTLNGYAIDDEHEQIFEKEREEMIEEGARIIADCIPGIHSFVFSPDDRFITGVVFGCGYKPGSKYTINNMPKVLIFTRPIQVGLETNASDKIHAHISASVWLPTVVLEMECSIKNCYFKFMKSIGLVNLHISNIREKAALIKSHVEKLVENNSSSGNVSVHAGKGEHSMNRGKHSMAEYSDKDGNVSGHYGAGDRSSSRGQHGSQRSGSHNNQVNASHGGPHGGQHGHKNNQGKQVVVNNQLSAKESAMIIDQEFPLMYKNLIPIENHSIDELKRIVDFIPMNIQIPIMIAIHTYQLAAALISPLPHRKQMYARYFETMEEIKKIYREKVVTVSHIFIEGAALADYLLTFSMNLITRKNTCAKIRSAFNSYRASLNLNYKVFEEDLGNEFLGYLRYIYDVEQMAKFLTLSASSSFISFDGNLPALFSVVKENYDYSKELPIIRSETEDLSYYDIKERIMPTIELEDLNLFSNPKIFQRINRMLYRSGAESARGNTSGYGSMLSSRSSMGGSSTSVAGGNGKQSRAKTSVMRSSRMSSMRSTRSSMYSNRSSMSSMRSSRMSSRASSSSSMSTARTGIGGSEDVDMSNEKLTSLFKKTYEMLKKLATMGWPTRTLPMSSGFIYVPHILESYVTMSSLFIRIGSSQHLYSFTSVKNDAWIQQGSDHAIIPKILTPDVICALKSINEGGFASIPYFTSPLLSCPESTATRIIELYASLLGRFQVNISNITLTRCKETFVDLLGSVPFLQRRTVKEERYFEDLFCNALYHQLSLYETLPCIAQINLESIPQAVQMAIGFHINSLEVKLEGPIQMPTVSSMKSTYYPEDYQYTPYTINKEYIPVFSKNGGRFRITSQLDYKMAYIEPQNVDNITYSTYYTRAGSISPLYSSMSATGDSINLSSNPSKFNMRGTNAIKYFGDVAKSFNSIYNTSTTPGKTMFSLNSMNTVNMINRERTLMVSHILCVLRSYPYNYGENFLSESNFLQTIAFRMASLLHMIGLRYDEKENFINYFNEHTICSVVRSFNQNLMNFYATGTNKVSFGQIMIYAIFISLFFGLQTYVPYSKRISSRTVIAIPNRTNQSGNEGGNTGNTQTGYSQYNQKQRNEAQKQNTDMNGPSGYYALSNSMTFLEGLDEKFQRILLSEMTCSLKITEQESCNKISRLKQEDLISENVMPVSSQSLGANTDIISLYKQPIQTNTLLHPMMAQVICHVPTEQKETEIEQKYNAEKQSNTDDANKMDLKKYKINEMKDSAKEVLNIFSQIKSTIDLQIYKLFDFANAAIKECPELKNTAKDNCMFLMEKYQIKDLVTARLLHFIIKLILIVGCDKIDTAFMFLFKLGIQIRESMTIFCEVSSSVNISAALVSFAFALAANVQEPYYSEALALKAEMDKQIHHQSEKRFKALSLINCLPQPLFVFDGMIIKPVTGILLDERLRHCKFTEDIMLIDMTTENSTEDFENALRKYAGTHILALKFRNKNRFKKPCMISNALYYIEWRQELHSIHVYDSDEAFPPCLPLPSKYRFINKFTEKVWEDLVFPTMSYMLRDSFLWNNGTDPLIMNPNSNAFMGLMSRNIASAIYRFALSNTYLFKDAIMEEPFGTSKERVLIKVLGSPLLRQYLVVITVEAILLALVGAFQPPHWILDQTKEFLEVYLKTGKVSEIFDVLNDESFTHYYDQLTMLEINDDNCDSGKFTTLFSWKYMTNTVLNVSPTYYEILLESFNRAVTSFFDITEYSHKVVFNSVIIRVTHGMKNEFIKIYETMTKNETSKKFNFLTTNIISYYVLYDKGMKTNSEFVKNTTNELINVIYENMDSIIEDSKMVLVIDATDIDVLDIPVINNIVDAVSSISNLMDISTTILFLVTDNTLNIGYDIYSQNTLDHFHEVHEKTMEIMANGGQFDGIQYDLSNFILYDGSSVESLSTPVSEGYYGIPSIPFIKDSILIWKEISIASLLKVLKAAKMTLVDLDYHIEWDEQKTGKKRVNLDVLYEDLEHPYDLIVERLSEKYPNIKIDYIHYFTASIFLHASYILSEREYLPKNIYDITNRQEEIINGVYISSGYLFIDALLAGFGRATKVSPFSKIGLYEIDVSPELFLSILYESNHIPKEEQPDISTIINSPLIHGVAYLKPDSCWGKLFIDGYAYGSDVGIPEMHLIFPKQARTILIISQYIKIYMKFPENTTIPYLLTHENSYEADYILSAALQIAFGYTKCIDFTINDTQLESGTMYKNIKSLFLQMATTRAIEGVDDNMMGWDDPQIVIFKLPKLSSPERNIGPISSFLRYYINMPFAQLSYSITREELNILIQRHNSTVITAPIPSKNNASILTKFIYHRVIPIIVTQQTNPGSFVYDEITQKYITTNSLNSLFLMSPITTTCLSTILHKTIGNVVAEVQENIDKSMPSLMVLKDSDFYTLFDDVTPKRLITKLVQRYQKFKEEDMLNTINKMLALLSDLEKSRHSFNHDKHNKRKYFAISSLGIDYPHELHYYNDILDEPLLPTDIGFTVEHNFFSDRPPKIMYNEIGSLELILSIIEQFKHVFHNVFSEIINQLKDQAMFMDHSIAFAKYIEFLENMRDENKKQYYEFDAKGKVLFKEYVEVSSRIMKSEEFVRKLTAKTASMETKIKEITKALQNDNIMANIAYCNELRESTTNLFDTTEESEISNIIPLMNYLYDCLKILNGDKVDVGIAEFADLTDFDSPTLMFEETSIPIPTQKIESFNYEDMRNLFKNGQFNFTPESKELLAPYVQNILFKEVIDYNPQYGNEIMEFRDPILLARDIAKWINTIVHTQSLSSTRLKKQCDVLTHKVNLYKRKINEQMASIEADRIKAESIYEEHDTCIKKSMEHHKLVDSVNKSLVEMKLIHDQIEHQVLPERFRKIYGLVSYNIVEYVLSLSIEFHMPKIYILHEETIMETLWNMHPFGPRKQSKLPTIQGTHKNMELNPQYIGHLAPSFFFYTNSPHLQLRAAGAISSMEMRLLALAVYTPLIPIVFDGEDLFGPMVFGYYPTANFYNSVDDYIQKVIGSLSLDDLKSREVSTLPKHSIIQISINDLNGSSPHATHFNELCNIYRKAWPDGPRVILLCREGLPTKNIKNFTYIMYPVSAESIAFRLAYHITKKKTMKFQKKASKIIENMEIDAAKADALIEALNDIREILMHNNKFVFNEDVISELTKLKNHAFEINKLYQSQVAEYKKTTEIVELLHENERSFLLSSYILISARQVSNNMNSSQFVSNILSDSFNLEPMWTVDVPNLITSQEILTSSITCRNQVQAKQGVANQNLKNHMFFKENSDTSLLNAKFTFWNTASKLPSYYRFQFGLLFTLESAATNEIILIFCVLIGAHKYMEHDTQAESFTERDIYNCLINCFANTPEDKKMLNNILKRHYEKNNEETGEEMFNRKYGVVINEEIEHKKMMHELANKQSVMDAHEGHYAGQNNGDNEFEDDSEEEDYEESDEEGSRSKKSGEEENEEEENGEKAKEEEEKEIEEEDLLAEKEAALKRSEKLDKFFGLQPYNFLFDSDLFRELGIHIHPAEVTDEDIEKWVEWANGPDVLKDDNFPIHIRGLSKNEERFKKLNHDIMVYWAKYFLCIMVNPSRLLELTLKLMKLATKGIVNLIDMGFTHNNKNDEFEPLSTDSLLLSMIPSTLSLMTNCDDIFQVPSTINISAFENSCSFLRLFEPSSFMPVPKYEDVVLLNVCDKETIVYQHLCELVQKPIMLILLLPSCPLHLLKIIGINEFANVHDEESTATFNINTVPWWIPLASTKLQASVLSRMVSRNGGTYSGGSGQNNNFNKKNPLNVHKDFRLGFIQQSNFLCETCANSDIVGLAWLEALGKTPGVMLGKIFGRRVINLTYSPANSSDIISENPINQMIVPLKTSGIDSNFLDSFVQISPLCMNNKSDEILGTSIEKGYKEKRLNELNERLSAAANKGDPSNLKKLYEGNRKENNGLNKNTEEKTDNKNDNAADKAGNTASTEQKNENKELTEESEYIIYSYESVNEKYRDPEEKYGFKKPAVKPNAHNPGGNNGPGHNNHDIHDLYDIHEDYEMHGNNTFGEHHGGDHDFNDDEKQQHHAGTGQHNQHNQHLAQQQQQQVNNRQDSTIKEGKYTHDQTILPLMFGAIYALAMLLANRNTNDDPIKETTVTYASSMKIYTHILLCSRCPKGRMRIDQDGKPKLNLGIGMVPWITSTIMSNVVTLDNCSKDQVRGEITRVFSYVLERIVRKYDKAAATHRSFSSDGEMNSRDERLSMSETTRSVIKSFIKDDLPHLFKIPMTASFSDNLHCIKTFFNCYGISHKELYTGCPEVKTYNGNGNIIFSNNLQLVYDSMMQNSVHFLKLEHVLALNMKKEFKFAPLDISAEKKALTRAANQGGGANARGGGMRRTQMQSTIPIVEENPGSGATNAAAGNANKQRQGTIKENGGTSTMTMAPNESVENDGGLTNMVDGTVSYEQQASTRYESTIIPGAKNNGEKSGNEIDIIMPNGSFFMYCYYSTIYSTISAFAISRSKMLATSTNSIMMDKNAVYTTIMPTVGGGITGANDVFRTKAVMNRYRLLNSKGELVISTTPTLNNQNSTSAGQNNNANDAHLHHLHTIPIEQLYIGNLIYELTQQYIKLINKMEQTDPILDITTHLDKINNNIYSKNVMKLPIGTNSGPVDGTSTYNLKKRSSLQGTQGNAGSGGNSNIGGNRDSGTGNKGGNNNNSNNSNDANAAYSLYEVAIPDTLDFGYKLPPYILPIEQITHYSSMTGNKNQVLPIYSSQSSCSILYPLISYLNNSIFYFRNALSEIKADLMNIAKLFSPIAFSGQESTTHDFARGVNLLVDKVPEKWRVLFLMPGEYDNNETISSISCNKFFRYSLPVRVQSLWKLYELVVHCISMVSNSANQASPAAESAGLIDYVMKYRMSNVPSGAQKPNISVTVQNTINYEILMKPIFDNFIFLLTHLPFKRYFEIAFIETMQRVQGMIDTVHKNRLCLSWDLQHVARAIAKGTISQDQIALILAETLDSGAANGIPPILCEDTTFAYLPLSSISLGYVATDISPSDRFQMYFCKCRSIANAKTTNLAHLYEKYQDMAVGMSVSFVPIYDMLFESVGWRKLVDMILEPDKPGNIPTQCVPGNNASFFFPPTDNAENSAFKSYLINDEGQFIAVVAVGNHIKPFAVESLIEESISLTNDEYKEARNNIQENIGNTSTVRKTGPLGLRGGGTNNGVVNAYAIQEENGNNGPNNGRQAQQRGKRGNTDPSGGNNNNNNNNNNNDNNNNNNNNNRANNKDKGDNSNNGPKHTFNLVSPPIGKLQVSILCEGDVLRIINSSKLTQVPYRLFMFV